MDFFFSFFLEVYILGPERLLEHYEKSYNVFNINTQDKGTQKKKKVQLPLEHSGPPKLYSLSLLMCYIRRKINLNMRDIMKT